MSFPITNALDPQNVANDLSINVSLCSRYTQIILSSNSLCVCCVAECTSISVSALSPIASSLSPLLFATWRKRERDTHTYTHTHTHTHLFFFHTCGYVSAVYYLTHLQDLSPDHNTCLFSHGGEFFLLFLLIIIVLYCHSLNPKLRYA
jgi:hypothetical protein